MSIPRSNTPRKNFASACVSNHFFFSGIGNFALIGKMIIFAEMISNMDTTTRVQTVIRLRPEVMERVKYRARSQSISVNAFIENALAEATKVPIPKLPKNFKISPLVESLSGIIPAPTKEMLESDDRLAYLLGK